MKVPKNILITAVLFLSLIFAIFSYFMFKNVIVELYCEKQDKKIVGPNWNVSLTPTEEERIVEGLSSIYWGHREERKCWAELESKLP